MPVNLSLYTETIGTNIKSDKDAKRFLLNFRINGKQVKRQYNYESKTWNRRTRIDKIKAELASLKEKLSSSETGISDTSTLDQVAQMYFKSREQTNWTKELEAIYRVHLTKTLGRKKVSSIRRVDIDNLRIALGKKGESVQNVNGCAPRTIRKILKQTLKPILDYAYENDIISKVPFIEVPKQPTKVKFVNNAEETFMTLYDVIHDIYADDPFYRSLFLFALYGRRLNEILTLTWDSIDILNSTYCIKAQYNKIGEDQFYKFPTDLYNSLLELGIDKGLIFKSPITGKKMTTPKRQLVKIKNKAKMKDLTMHKFRHILASYLATKPNTTTFTLAATLGHKDPTTAAKHYITHESVVATSTMINIIDSDIKDKS